MGSFNTSCFASHQTIAPGDRCFVVAVMQQSTYEPVEMTFRGQPLQLYGPASSVCHPDAYWEPVSHFIEAKYEDYGCVTLVKSRQNGFKLSHFFEEALQYMPSVSAGKNQYHDVPLDLSTFMGTEQPNVHQFLTAKRDEDRPQATEDECFSAFEESWDYVFRAAQESRTFWHHQRSLRPMSFAFIHGAAWERLRALTASSKNWSGESYEPREVFDRAIGAFKERLTELNKKEPRDEHDTPAVRRFFAFDAFREHIRRIGDSSGSGLPGDYRVFRHLEKMLNEDSASEDAVFKALAPYLEERYVVSALEALNLHFQPMVYAGQDYSNQIGQNYRRFVSNVEGDVTRARIEDSFGKLRSYSVDVLTSAIVPELDKHARKYDSRVLLLEVLPPKSSSGQRRLVFECPMDIEDLREMLTDFLAQGDAGRILLDTLELVEATD